MRQNYDPNALFDRAIAHLALNNDRALGCALQVAPPLIRKMRRGQLPVSGVVLLRLHEVTGISLPDLRASMGDRRCKFRLSFHGHDALSACQRR